MNNSVLHEPGNALDGHHLHNCFSVREAAKGDFRPSLSLDVSPFPCVSCPPGGPGLAGGVIYSIQYERAVFYGGNRDVFQCSRYWSDSLGLNQTFMALDLSEARIVTSRQHLSMIMCLLALYAWLGSSIGVCFGHSLARSLEIGHMIAWFTCFQSLLSVIQGSWSQEQHISDDYLHSIRHTCQDHSFRGSKPIYPAMKVFFFKHSTHHRIPIFQPFNLSLLG